MHPAELAQLVTAHCRTRQLRQAQVQLCWDLLLVLQRAKPAFLLDYACVDVRPLTALLLELQRLSGVQCALLSWGSNCHLVCNQTHTLERLQEAADACASGLVVRPVMVGFCTSAASTSSAVLTQEQGKAVLSALEPLRAALEHTLPASQVLTLNLEKLHGLPLMPTLNGWLLGYPVIYVVTSIEESQQAARCLSMNDITVCQAISRGISVHHRSSAEPWDTFEEQYPGDITLSAFSVPTQLLQLQDWVDSSSVHTATAECSNNAIAVEQQSPLGSPHIQVAMGLPEAAQWSVHADIAAWFNGIQSRLQGQGWVARVACQKEHRGLQPVNL